MLAIIGITLGAGIAILFALALCTNRVADRNAASIAAAKDHLLGQFGEGDYHLAMPGPACLGIVWDSNRLIIGDASAPRSIPLADLREANVEIDGVNVTNSRTVTKTNRGSQLAGGLVGGVLLGPVGLLAGGLSGSSTATGKAVEKRKIKSVKLVVRIADRTAPLHTFTFCDHSYCDGFEANSPIIAPAMERAAHYHALLQQIVEERPSQDRSAAGAPASPGIAGNLAVMTFLFACMSLALPTSAHAYDLGKTMTGKPEVQLASTKPLIDIERCVVMGDLPAPPVVYRSPNADRSIIHGGRSQPIFAFELTKTANGADVAIWQGKGFQAKVQHCL